MSTTIGRDHVVNLVNYPPKVVPLLTNMARADR